MAICWMHPVHLATPPSRCRQFGIHCVSKYCLHLIWYNNFYCYYDGNHVIAIYKLFSRANYDWNESSQSKEHAKIAIKILYPRIYYTHQTQCIRDSLPYRLIPFLISMSPNIFRHFLLQAFSNTDFTNINFLNIEFSNIELSNIES